MPHLTYRGIDDARLRGWVIRERVRCGNPGCHCSTRGTKHGPYYYLLFPVFDPTLGGYKLKKEYVRRQRAATLRRQIRKAKVQVRRQHAQAKALLAVLDGPFR